MGARCPYAAAAIVSKQKRRFTENGYNLDLVNGHHYLHKDSPHDLPQALLLCNI